MPISLASIHGVLLPGLIDVYGHHSPLWSWNLTKELAAANVFNGEPFVLGTPHIWVPLPAAIALGAAAVVVKNPEVTRRFWQGWLK